MNDSAQSPLTFQAPVFRAMKPDCDLDRHLRNARILASAIGGHRELPDSGF